MQFFDPVTIYPEYRPTSDDCQGNPVAKRRRVSEGFIYWQIISREITGPL